MMLYNPFFSLFMAFIAASSVAASATPVRRGGGLPYRPSLPISPIPASKCNQQNIQCCNNVTPQSSPQITSLLGSAAILGSVDPNMAAGMSCTSILSGGTCNNQALCCENNNAVSAVSFNCVPVDL